MEVGLEFPGGVGGVTSNMENPETEKALDLLAELYEETLSYCDCGDSSSDTGEWSSSELSSLRKRVRDLLESHGRKV